MFDADDPESVLTEMFVVIVLPPGLVLVGGWLTFRLLFDGFLAGIHPLLAERITVGDGPGAGGMLVAGHARFALLMAAGVVVGLVVVALYVRANRDAFREGKWS